MLLSLRCDLFLVNSKSISTFWSHFLRRKTMRQKNSKRYADTLFLPKTDFPLSVKNGLAPKHEEDIQKVASFDDLYRWQSSRNRQKVFVLHDGPPYANGRAHVGHALNKILKDITIRYKLLCGYKIHYVPGFDCHGMPIELKALNNLAAIEPVDKLTPLQIREHAERVAVESIDQQVCSFKRWGIMADWTSYYTTMSSEYQDTQLDVFFKVYEQGLIYRDFMPVYWSPSSRTALAESELEYNDEHRSCAVYLRFPVTCLSQQLADISGDRPVFAVIWTTTPWTLPFNKAVCYGESLVYAIIRNNVSSELFLCEEQFFDTLVGILKSGCELVDKLSGADLNGIKYTHPINKTELPFLAGNHVTSGKGTGLVHTAPAHGRVDFQVALRNNIVVECSVDENGRYMDHAVVDGLRGCIVGVDADEAVIQILGDSVLRKEDFIHSYPYDWRTKKPVIIRASMQWFVDTEKLMEQASQCLKDVNIIPRQSEQHMLQLLQNRPYWCISRQRVWGLPIPVFYHRHTGEPLITRETVDHLRMIFRQHGVNCWWIFPISQLLPSDVLNKINGSSPDDYYKGGDILDIWFDSGVSWASVLKDVGYQADLCLEGMDQFHCWFQTSLIMSTILQGQAPYRNLMAHGFTTDEHGKKMSKSVGNVVDPDDVVYGGKDLHTHPAYGSDVLRWWAAHGQGQHTIMIGPQLLQQLSHCVFKFRKTMRYLLGNLRDFHPQHDTVPYTQLLPQDRYLLHLLYEFIHKVGDCYEKMSYGQVLQELEKFVNGSVSRFYINSTRDRSYCNRQNSLERRSCQVVQHHLLKHLCVMAAPILPHLMEEVFAHLPAYAKDTDVLFHGSWPRPGPEWNNPNLKNIIDPIFAVRDSVVDALGSHSPSQFGVIIYASPLLMKCVEALQAEETSCSSPLCEIIGTSHTSVLRELPGIIPEDCLFISGSVDIHSQDEHGSDITVPSEYKLMIVVSETYQCQRCRRYTSESDDAICDRCLDVIG